MKAVTANRLDDGAVVFLAEDDGWTAELCQAARFSDEDAKLGLDAARARTGEIADAYLVTVDENGDLVGRETLRESIRKSGPTVRTDLGYQAGAGQ
ncbi:MAG: DUF2849 domain-containing protein [Pseudomonadota bacterium]